MNRCMKSYTLKRKILHCIYHVFTLCFAVAMIYPLLWMIMGSFKDTAEIVQNAGKLLPGTFQLRKYAEGWAGFGGITFATFFKNSFVIAGLATVGAVISSSCIGYGFARCNFPTKGLWFSCMLISMMLPFQVIMIPQYIMFSRMGWIGTYLPLILPSFFGGGFFIFLNIQFIKGIPKDLDEAAKIDGCSVYGIYFRIILPLIKPAIVTSAIFSFMWKWDDFLGALLFLKSPRQYPVAYALKMFADPTAGSDYGALFAMSTLSVVPIFLIFVTMQKYLVEGIASSGIKG